MHLRKRIINNFVGILISEAIGKGALFFSNIILARRLGVNNFGLFVLAQTIVSSAWILTDLGTTMYGIREVARKKTDNIVIGQLLSMKIITGLVFFLLYVSIIYIILESSEFQKRLIFLSCGLYLVTYPLYFDWIFKGLEKFHVVSLSAIAYGCFFLVLTTIFVKDSSSVIMAGVLWSASYVVGGLVLYVCLLKLKIRLIIGMDFKVWYRHLRHSIHFLFSGLASMIYAYVPIFIIGYVLEKYDVGIFSAAYKVILVISAPAYYISLAIFPIISELYTNDLDNFKKLDKMMFGIYGISGLLIALVLYLFARHIILIVYGSTYQDSILIFEILCWVLPMQFVRYKFSQFIASTELQRLQIIASLCALLFYFIYFTLIKFTIVSIALSVVLGETVLLLSYMMIWKIVRGQLK